MKASKHGKKAESDKKCNLFDLLNEVFRKNRSTLVKRWERGPISGCSDADEGGVTVSMMKRDISKTGLSLRMAR